MCCMQHMLRFCMCACVARLCVCLYVVRRRSRRGSYSVYGIQSNYVILFSHLIFFVFSVRHPFQ